MLSLKIFTASISKQEDSKVTGQKILNELKTFCYTFIVYSNLLKPKDKKINLK